MKMRKVISVILIAVVMISSVCVMTSCGKKEEEKPKTLEEYIQKTEGAEDELQKIGESMSNEVLDGSVDIVDNSIVYHLKMKEVYESEYFDAFSDSFADQMDEYSDRFTELIDDIEEKSGIKGIDVQVIVENGDGTEIYSDTFTK